MVIRKDDLMEIWKREGGTDIAQKIARLQKVLEGSDLKPGKSGDAWLDDWGEDKGEDKPDTKPDPPPKEDQPADDWQDVTYDG